MLAKKEVFEEIRCSMLPVSSDRLMTQVVRIIGCVGRESKHITVKATAESQHGSIRISEIGGVLIEFQ